MRVGTKGFFGSLKTYLMSIFNLKFVSRVEIALSFLISSWVLVGPGLEFPHLEKTDRGPVST